MKKFNENTDQSIHYSFSLFMLSLSMSIASLIINWKIDSIFFIILIIIIIMTVLFIFTRCKSFELNIVVSLIYSLIGLISLIIVVFLSLEEQRIEIKSKELKNREQAEYLIKNCKLMVVGVNKGILTVQQNGYLCNDGVTYYISQNYVTK